MLPLLLLRAVAADYLSFTTDVPKGDGKIVIEVNATQAPLGAAHLHALVNDSFYNGAAFFRVVPGFVVQFGIAGIPAENAKWKVPIKDDPVIASNTFGTLTYATAGPNTRTSQLFINLADNHRLDAQGFAPFGRVVQGMDVVQAISNPTPGSSGGVDQDRYATEGNAWIRKAYPNINSIKNATFGKAAAMGPAVGPLLPPNTMRTVASQAATFPYCNVAMDTGVIPPLPKSGELVQVQVFIRHGSRTPSSLAKTPSWAGAQEAEYDCTARLLEAPDADLPDPVLFSKQYLRGRNELPGNCMLGQLVSAGLDMCRSSGRHLKAAYGHFLPDTPIGNEQAFFLRSDDVPRTIASGQALFSAMYPASMAKAGSAVPWHTMDGGSDAETILPNTRVCPALGPAYVRAAANFRQTAHYRNVSTPLASELSTALNRTIAPDAIGRLLDPLMSVSCPTVPRVRGGSPPAAFTPALQLRAVAEAADALYGVLNDTNVARFGAGPLIGEMLASLERATLEQTTSTAAPKFVLWSGHDTGPMAPVLAALRVGGAEFPRFNDLLAVELHRAPSAAARRTPSGHPSGHPSGREGRSAAASEYAVRLVHNGQVVTPLVPGCPKAELCPYIAFHATAAKLVPTPAECGRTDDPSWWPEPIPEARPQGPGREQQQV